MALSLFYLQFSNITNIYVFLFFLSMVILYYDVLCASTIYIYIFVYIEIAYGMSEILGIKVYKTFRLKNVLI